MKINKKKRNELEKTQQMKQLQNQEVMKEDITGIDSDKKMEPTKRIKAEDDDDNEGPVAKIPKVILPGLPDSSLNVPEDKPKSKNEIIKSEIISTTKFVAENIVSGKMYPSRYKEDGIFVQSSIVGKQTKPKKIKAPTFSLAPSTSGYTGNIFKITKNEVFILSV